MRIHSRSLASLVLAAGMVAPVVMTTGCAEHHYVRVFDPYYNDYHYWSPAEETYYNNWLVETHRPHVEFRALEPPQQREYWAWRHGRHEHEHR